MLDEEELQCPLCNQEFDTTDKDLHPCKCGYRICGWCLHKRDRTCPECHNIYERRSGSDAPGGRKSVSKRREENIHMKRNSSSSGVSTIDINLTTPPQFIQNLTGAKIATAALASYKASGKVTECDREELALVRVLQRNLLYVVGIAQSAAKEDILKKRKYFGRFGQIVKIAINKKQAAGTGGNASYSAYITFKDAADAREAIHTINGNMIDNRIVRATYGTTKYCSYFLSRGITCTNPQCLYLHELAEPEDCFTKDELAASDRFSPEFVGPSNSHILAANHAAAVAAVAQTQQDMDSLPSNTSAHDSNSSSNNSTPLIQSSLGSNPNVWNIQNGDISGFSGIIPIPTTHPKYTLTPTFTSNNSQEEVSVIPPMQLDNIVSTSTCTTSISSLSSSNSYAYDDPLQWASSILHFFPTNVIANNNIYNPSMLNESNSPHITAYNNHTPLFEHQHPLNGSGTENMMSINMNNTLHTNIFTPQADYKIDYPTYSTTAFHNNSNNNSNNHKNAYSSNNSNNNNKNPNHNNNNNNNNNNAYLKGLAPLH